MNKVVAYDTKNKNLKQLSYFNMISYYDHFSNEMQNLVEFVHFQEIHIYSKRVYTSNVIYWGNCKCFKTHVAKKILQKILFMKKSKKFKKFKKAHLWLNPLSLLTHLIVIAPHVD